MKTKTTTETREAVEKIVSKHCRYCNQKGTMYELRCKYDVEGQVDDVMQLLAKEKKRLIGDRFETF